MDTYTNVSYEIAKTVTERYSTSFSLSSSLFDRSIRKHIYAIYALVRIADEIVDTYRATDADAQLTHLQQETKSAMKSGYSTNPIVHAFANTARTFHITASLVDPFFASMRTDLTKATFTPKEYADYIHGSAEVVGLMCLKVFVSGDEELYAKQKAPARALGAAYQKVNFLRDMKADYAQLGRVYFPGVAYDTFGESEKRAIIKDIKHDFAKANTGIEKLPMSARRAVRMSYQYYYELLKKLEDTPAALIKEKRVRLPNTRKLWMLLQARAAR